MHSVLQQDSRHQGWSEQRRLIPLATCCVQVVWRAAEAPDSMRGLLPLASGCKHAAGMDDHSSTVQFTHTHLPGSAGTATCFCATNRAAARPSTGTGGNPSTCTLPVTPPRHAVHAQTVSRQMPGPCLWQGMLPNVQKPSQLIPLPPSPPPSSLWRHIAYRTAHKLALTAASPPVCAGWVSLSASSSAQAY